VLLVIEEIVVETREKAKAALAQMKDADPIPGCFGLPAQAG
jgi:hypothetical protein